MKNIVTIFLVLFSFAAKAQKVESIHFNLYTDSLKKGVHNYINVDGKLTNGSFLPLMADEVIFSSTDGKWEGNSLILDSSFTKDSVIVTAWLKAKPDTKKSVTIYMKKILLEPTLKTEKELIEEWSRKDKKNKT